MRRILSTAAVLLTVVLASAASAGPGIGITIDTNSMTGNGSSGNALGLRRNCSAGEGLLWNGTTWACGTGGDITSVVAGNGLTGGGTTGAVTLDVAVGTGLSVAADQINLNLAGGSCSSGSFVTALSSTGTATCSAATSIVSGTTNRLAKFTSSTAVGNSGITDDGTTITFSERLGIGGASPAGPAQNWIVGAGPTTTTQLYIQETDALHTAFEAINIVGIQSGTFDTTAAPATARGAEFDATSNRVAGGNILQNIGVVSNAANGDENYSWYSSMGAMRNDGNGNTFGSSSFATALTSTGTLSVTGGGRVTLGLNLDGFEVLPGGTNSAVIGIGNFNQGTPFSIKNTTANPSGMTIHADTTLNANVSATIGFLRGAGNGSDVAGIALIGNAGGYCVNSVVDSLCMSSYDPGSVGRELEFATGTGPTVRMKISNAGAVSILAGALDMNSHKVTSLTNGASAQDAAAFGQIASGVNAAVSGTSGTVPKFTGTNTIGNSSITDTSGAVALSGPSSGAVLTLSDATQATERLRFAGQEYYQAAHTSTDGITFLLGLQRSGNRALWIADSAQLASNATNAILTVGILASSGGSSLDTLATDTTTALPMALNSSGGAVTIGGNVSISGAKTLTVGGTSSFGDNVTVASGKVLSGRGEWRDGGTQFTTASCGTTPTKVGGATHGAVTIGATGTGCVITYGGGLTFGTAAMCQVTTGGASKTATWTYTPTALTIASATAGQTYEFDCWGAP